MGFWMWQNGYHHDIARLGEPGSLAFIGPEWASAAASPGALFKFYAAEGGLRVPLIVSGPGVAALGFVPARSFVTDITPTILDFAEADQSERQNLSGRSLRPILDSTSTDVYEAREPVGLEVSGNSALFKDGFKLVRNTAPHGDGRWRLYYLREDPGETRDLSEKLPSRFEEMLRDYADYEARYGVLPVPDDYDALKTLKANTLAKIYARYGSWFVLSALLLLGALGFLFRRRIVSRM
jgi:arylsulfatase/uncharacterized sulfatase